MCVSVRGLISLLKPRGPGTWLAPTTGARCGQGAVMYPYLDCCDGLRSYVDGTMWGLGIKVQLIELNALATYLARPIVLGFRTGRGDIAPNGLGGPEGEIRLPRLTFRVFFANQQKQR